jgi:hypothetical protein
MMVGAIRGRALDTERDLVRQALEGEGLYPDAPDWMFFFISLIANGQHSDSFVRLPTGYPHGENGLMNALLEIEETVLPLGIYDEGESVVWVPPKLGLAVYWSREAGGIHYHALIRPIESNWRQWYHQNWHLR